MKRIEHWVNNAERRIKNIPRDSTANQRKLSDTNFVLNPPQYPKESETVQSTEQPEKKQKKVEKVESLTQLETQLKKVEEGEQSELSEVRTFLHKLREWYKKFPRRPYEPSHEGVDTLSDSELTDKMIEKYRNPEHRKKALETLKTEIGKAYPELSPRRRDALAKVYYAGAPIADWKV